MLLGEPCVESDLRIATPVFPLLIEEIGRGRRAWNRVGQIEEVT